MKIKSIMRPARTISPEANIKDAAIIMNKYRIGSLIVTDGKKCKGNESRIVGIITERDILEKVTVTNKIPSKVLVEDIMTKKLVTIGPDALIDDAVYLLIKHKIKKLPVIKEGELLGIITSTDMVNNSDEIGQFYLFD